MKRFLKHCNLIYYIKSFSISSKLLCLVSGKKKYTNNIPNKETRLYKQNIPAFPRLCNSFKKEMETINAVKLFMMTDTLIAVLRMQLG